MQGRPAGRQWDKRIMSYTAGNRLREDEQAAWWACTPNPTPFLPCRLS
jgi:hypothetical protein